MEMLILGSGSDASQGREWFLAAAPHTSRVFLVVRTASETSVRWVVPNVAWHQLEPASALEAEEATLCVEGREPDGSLAWNDVEHATAIWRLFKEGNAAQ
ncbi:MAG: hypothetical protein ACSLFQ_08080 [Thermoanaerobaculia bacterium]